MVEFPAIESESVTQLYKQRKLPSESKANMWKHRVQKVTDKSRAMKRTQENIRVLYFASDCAEPYVEVRYAGYQVIKALI